MPAAVIAACAAFQMVPAGENKIACFDRIIDIFNQRFVAAVLTCKSQRLFVRACVNVAVDCFANKNRQTFRA